MKYIIKLFISVIFILAHTVSVSAESTKGGVYTLVTSTDQIVSGGTYLIAAFKYKETNELLLMTTRRMEDNSSGFYSFIYSDKQETIIDLSNIDINVAPVYPNNTTSPHEYIINKNSSGYTFQDVNNYYLDRDSKSLYLSSNKCYWSLENRYENDIYNEFRFSRKTNSGTYYLKYSNTNTFNATTGTNKDQGAKPFINLYKKSETTQITISQAKYSTLYYENNDVYLPEGLEGFTILQSEGKLKKGTKYGSTNVIPAGTAVVLYGEPGNYDISLLPHNEENISPSNNLLRGNETEQAVTQESSLEKYVLSYNGDISTIGFYRIGTYDGITCPAHKAYLSLPKEMTSKAILFSELNETTGIDIIKRETSNTHESEALFDISGRKVNKMSKGLYIKNKKKIFIK